MGKGNTTTTSGSRTALPAYQEAYKALLGQLQGTTGNVVNNLQSEFGNSGYDLSKPYINSAQDYITQAGTPFTQASLQPYLDPYTQQVVDATQNEFNLQNGQQQNQLVGSIAANGAFEGDRGAVLQAQLAGQQQTAQAPIIAGLYNQGYNTALSQYNADRERELAAGYGEAGLGSETQGLALQGIMAPLEAEFGLAGAETGLGNAAGYNFTQSQTTTPSFMSQLFGAGETGLGLLGMLAFQEGGAVTNSGRGIVVPFPSHRARRTGGGIRRFADGGDNTDDSNYVPGWPVTGNLAHAAPIVAPLADADGQQPFTNTYTPLKLDTHYAEEEKRAPWMALLSAGAGTLATGNIGVGFQKGIESYENRHKSDIEQQEKAAELENEGDYRKVNLDKDVYEINQRAKQAAAELSSTNAYREAEIQNWGLERMQAAANAHREDVLNGLVPPDQIATPNGPAASHGSQLESYITQAFPGSTITSGMRTVAQNTAVNGVPNSAHLTDNARDFVPPSGITLEQAANHFNSLGIPGLKAIPEGPGAANSTGPHVHVQYTSPIANSAPSAFIPPKMLGEPVELEVDDGKGGTRQLMAQQNKMTGQWVTADQNRTPISSDNMRIIPTSQATGGGRYAGQINRVMTAARDAAAELNNIVSLPLGATTGVFGGRHQGPSLLDATKEMLANEVSAQDTQFTNASMIGLGKALATLESGGMQTNQALLNQFEGYALKEGDTNMTKMYKLALARQGADNALDANMASPLMGREQKALAQRTKDELAKAIPWTPMDVQKLAYSQDPKASLRQFAGQSNLGSAGARTAKDAKGNVYTEQPNGKWVDKNGKEYKP